MFLLFCVEEAASRLNEFHLARRLNEEFHPVDAQTCIQKAENRGLLLRANTERELLLLVVQAAQYPEILL
jgi:hypothetical protein